VSVSVTDTINRDSATPIYVQLTALIKDKIRSGEWQPEQKILSENEFNNQFGISRMTARNVIARLVDEGLLFRVQGKGTFVAPPKIQTRSPGYLGIREQLEQQGFPTKTEVISAEVMPAGDRFAEQLGIDPLAEVSAIQRLRSVEGEPISLHFSFVPVALAPDLTDTDLAGQQLCVILAEQYGLHSAHVIETLETTATTKTYAKWLGERIGQPLLRLEQIVSTSSGQPFEFTRIMFRGDRIKLEFHYDS
jgi:GntR family transcriptional regulator